ncbi:MAG: hypothetical protein U0166_12730 [Acidobacteriota bacterium]
MCSLHRAACSPITIPRVLSIILMVAGTAALLVRGRRWAVFALAFIYS